MAGRSRSTSGTREDNSDTGPWPHCTHRPNHSYYRDASIAILVYDVTDDKSFQSMDYWLKELEEKKEKEGMILVVVGNKCDLPNRVVSQEAADKWSKSKQLQYF